MSNDYTLPETPNADGEVRTAFGVRPVYLRQTMLTYGHACAEAARAPLLERIAKLERSVIECANTGVRMMDAADQEISRLRADLAAKAGEVEALRSGIEKAMSEIDDAGPKALKYARQELEAAIAARKGEGGGEG